MALVVYDMQVGILKQIKNPDAIVAKVSRVLDAARTAGVRTFFMRHMSLPKELMGAFCYRMAMAWQRTDDPEKVAPWFLRDSPGFQITPELKPRQSEAIFDKLTMSALEGTPLSIALRDCGITSMTLVGVAMEIGIEPTARHAADLGIVPVLLRTPAAVGTSRPRNGPSSRLGSPVTPFLPMSKRSARRCSAEADERLRAIRRPALSLIVPCGPGVTRYRHAVAACQSDGQPRRIVNRRAVCRGG
jgi:nicotinamidase-related amidase